MIRTRFAPSPTGYLHVGGLRTALYSYLVAKQAGGDFLLRIEDTDRERHVEDGTLNILKSLYWAGIVPDEGVCFGKNQESKKSRKQSDTVEESEITEKGGKGPYIQSRRLEIYEKYAWELLAKGHAYYCFCTAERLSELREYQQKNKLPTGYDGACLKIDPEEAKERTKTERHVTRLKMPKEGETVFNDLIRGEVRFKNILVDDQVLIKSDGYPTYHLAVVVDDHLMEITHVIRGEEWISSTPKHLQLYKYFGWEPPLFAHLPLLLNPDKSKLSKRQGDVAVEDYMKKGYLPEALINFVAFLGWNPGGERELFSLDELVKEFSLEKVSKAGAVFNLEKLDWYNKEYLKRMPLGELVKRAEPWLEPEIKKAKKQENKWLEKVVALEMERVTTLAELPEALKFVFELPEYEAKLLVWKKGSLDEVKKIFPELKVFLMTLPPPPAPPRAGGDNAWTKAELEQKVGEWTQKNAYSTGSVLWPLRVALSGQQNSPGPFEIAEVLGKEEALRRVETAIEKLSS